MYGVILVITLARALSNSARACLEHHDCNSYIQMVQSIDYNSEIASHHAMRILPPVLVKGLQLFGLSMQSAFKILSDAAYVFFGLLSYYVLRQYVKPIIAFSFTLFCLAGHSAMRIPLQNVYQTCDMLIYPLSLLIVFFSLRQQTKWVFVLAMIGIFVRQNMFVLGLLSLVFLYWQQRRPMQLVAIATLVASYVCLQSYYHANEAIANMAVIPADFFVFSNLWSIFFDSKIIEIILPMLPLIALYYKRAIPFLIKNWHISLYIAIVVGQPFVAYHMTGNNFDRLALQGLWLVYLIIPMANTERFQIKYLNFLLLGYAVSVYFTWSFNSRLIYMTVFSATLLACYLPRLARGIPKRGIPRTSRGA